MKLKHLFDKNYYKYLYHQLKRKNLSEYIFIDFKTIVVLSLLFILNIILFYPGKLTINIPKLDNQVNTLETLIKALSTFIIIIFSFIVLSFNIFYRYFGRFAFLNFFKNRLIKVLFTIFLFTIGFMVYSTIYLREAHTADNYSNSLYIISLLLTILTVLLIFPTVITLLRNSQNRKNILSIIEGFNSEWLIS